MSNLLEGQSISSDQSGELSSKVALSKHRSRIQTDIEVPHEVWDLYMFDWFEVAATAGDKMCA